MTISYCVLCSGELASHISSIFDTRLLKAVLGKKTLIGSLNERLDISGCLFDFGVNFRANLTFSYSQLVSGLKVHTKTGDH